MSLIGTAHADYLEILHDEDTGGIDIDIISPASELHQFKAFSSDIHLAMDPGTGETVTGRQCSVSVSIRDLEDVGFEGVRGVAQSASKPWVVETVDANGHQHTFKVVAHHPDRSHGSMVLMLEGYTPL
jgi:hypothetical protein